MAKNKADKAKDPINRPKEYIYIVQAFLEPSKCKIGITNDLDRRLKEYNNMTGKSKDNIYKYLFTCEVKDMAQLENSIKEHFPTFGKKKARKSIFITIHCLRDMSSL